MAVSDRKNIDAIKKAQKQLLTAKPKPRKRENVQRFSAGLWVRPFHSDALGVNPDQIEEAREHLRAHGITADFDSEGRCIVTSDKQFRDVAKATGLWSGRDGFAVRSEDNHVVPTGRSRQRLREEFKRAVERGDFD